MSALCEAEATYAAEPSRRRAGAVAGQRHIAAVPSASVAGHQAEGRPVVVRPVTAVVAAPRVPAKARPSVPLPGSATATAGSAARLDAVRPVGAAARSGLCQPPARPTTLRLTRRGRRLVAALAIIMATLALALGWLVLAGGAQAADHGAPGAGYAGMTRVVVKPGQTLWMIAAAAEPSADPRSVIAEIMQVNALSSTAIQPGEQLWVPKS
jgi:nucleoid-associated protein YgaU